MGCFPRPSAFNTGLIVQHHGVRHWDPARLARVALLPAVIAGWTCAATAAVAAEAVPKAVPEIGPRVVVSILPLHSLVAGVMAGVGAPRLLVRGAVSAHRYALRPSDARALSAADLVVWVGPGLESFLAKPLRALAGRARVVALGAEPGIELLRRRVGGADPAAVRPGDESARNDPHIWLDPENATRMVQFFARILGAMDPDHGPIYRANAARLAARLDRLDADLAAALTPLKEVPYVVFHDAYGYLEARYGLRRVAAVTINPEDKPGARRLVALRREIIAAGVVCVFTEPQFKPALVAAMTAGTPGTLFRSAPLDPLGAALAPGPEAYFELMRELSQSLVGCLGATGQVTGQGQPGPGPD